MENTMLSVRIRKKDQKERNNSLVALDIAKEW